MKHKIKNRNIISKDYLCARGIDFASFYDFCIGFWKFSGSVVFHFVPLDYMQLYHALCVMLCRSLFVRLSFFAIMLSVIVERGKIDTPSTQIHDRLLSCLGTLHKKWGD
jgi:hypothetical protein